MNQWVGWRRCHVMYKLWSGQVAPPRYQLPAFLLWVIREKFLRPRRTDMGLTIGIVLILLGFTQLHRTLSEPRPPR